MLDIVSPNIILVKINFLMLAKTVSVLIEVKSARRHLDGKLMSKNSPHCLLVMNNPGPLL